MQKIQEVSTRVYSIDQKTTIIETIINLLSQGKHLLSKSQKSSATVRISQFF